jgi:hypothetical protein
MPRTSASGSAHPRASPGRCEGSAPGLSRRTLDQDSPGCTAVASRAGAAVLAHWRPSASQQDRTYQQLEAGDQGSLVFRSCTGSCRVARRCFVDACAGRAASRSGARARHGRAARRRRRPGRCRESAHPRWCRTTIPAQSAPPAERPHTSACLLLPGLVECGLLHRVRCRRPAGQHVQRLLGG